MKKKILISLVLLAIMCFGVLTTNVFATTYTPTIKEINEIHGGESTLYVNSATSIGGNIESIDYLYSANIINAPTISTSLKKLLKAPYKNLVPTFSSNAQTVGMAVSTSGTPNSNWASSEWVTRNVLQGELISITNGISNVIDSQELLDMQSDATIKVELENENKIAFDKQEEVNEQQWINDGHQDPYIPAQYVPLDFTNTQINKFTLSDNQIAISVGTFLTGPFFNVKNGITEVSYDINRVMHKINIVSATTEKNTKLNVIVEDTTNGTITADKTSTISGETITLTATPTENYKIKSIKILKASDNSDITSAVSYNSTSKTFTMPNYNVKAKAEFESINYTFLEGANGSIANTSKDNLKFRINAEYSLLNKVYVDNEEVSSDKIITASGSTIITLKNDYLKTLTAGKHTLKVSFTDGKEAITDFEIKAENIVEKDSTPKTGKESKNYFGLCFLTVGITIILFLDNHGDVLYGNTLSKQIY